MSKKFTEGVKYAIYYVAFMLAKAFQKVGKLVSKKR